MAIQGFAPTSFSSISAMQGSSSHALPGAGTTALIVNMGPAPAAVLLSDSADTPVDGGSGTVVMPGRSLALTIGSNTYISVVALGYGSAWLNVSVGS